MVEYPGGCRVPARRDIGTGLLVQPPAGQIELGSHRQCFLKDDAVRLEEGIGETPPRCPCGRAVARGRSRGVDLVVGDEHTPPAERGRSMYKRLRARLECRTGTRSAAARGMQTNSARSYHLAWQEARRAPRRARPSAHRRSVPAHPRAVAHEPRRLLVILLQELDDQPPSRVEVWLGRDEASKLSNAHRLIAHHHRVANVTRPAPLPAPISATARPLADEPTGNLDEGPAPRS